MISRPFRDVLLALTLTGPSSLTLPLVWPSGCVLDTAHVEAVEPATFSVLATLRCGGVRCWTRFIEQDGQRIRESQVCEATGDGQRDRLVVP